MKSKKLLLVAILAATAALAGCSTPNRLPERVLVPVVAERPAPAVPARPTAPASLHDASAPDADKARAIAEYIEQLHGHIDALRALLDGYAKPKANLE